MKIEHIKSEIKQIYREPTMILFFLMPLFISLIFKGILIYITPFMRSTWVPISAPTWVSTL